MSFDSLLKKSGGKTRGGAKRLKGEFFIICTLSEIVRKYSKQSVNKERQNYKFLLLIFNIAFLVSSTTKFYISAAELYYFRSFYMLQINCIAITSWIVMIIAIFPHMGLFQKQSMDKSRFEKILRNFTSAAIKGLGSFSNDKDFAIPQKLDDMTPTSRDTFDFIIVGAGSAGSTTAARLSELKGVKVLLIEAGDEENILMDVPLLATYVSVSKDINWNYEIESSSNYCRGMKNKKCTLARGKVMGGCSTINYMIGTRCSPQIYDNWAKMGCAGWSYKDVLPLFKKLENFEVNDSAINWSYHGRNGPLHITRTPDSFRTEAGNAFLKAGLELGYPEVDLNGAKQIGFAKAPITTKNGMRFSVNRAYLHTIKGRQNLYVTKNSLVEKVLIDNKMKRATGVVFRKNGKLIQVTASKEVILSAGAINSPQILMLSGIGPAAHLKKHSIPVIKDAPVGENLIDHLLYAGLSFVVNASITVTPRIFSPSNPAVKQYIEKREGIIAIPVATDTLGFINVDNPKNRDGPPNIQLIHSSVSAATLLASNLEPSHFNFTFAKLTGKPAYLIVVVLIMPKSIGKILLRSNKPQDAPIINPNYIDDPSDIKRLILGIREAIKLSKTAALQKYKSEVFLNPILGCEKFKLDSDDYWGCAIRTFGISSVHPVGTCKMGAAKDRKAVVDPRLKVIGIQGLRVADASIMPTIVNGHPNVPIIMIAEKLVEMIKADWKL